MKLADALAPIEILLVEDNPADIRLTQEAFRDSRIPNNIRVARDGVDALEILRSEVHGGRPLDIVFLDLNLPRKDGREVLAEIRGDESLKAIPVVILTTSRSEEDVLHAYEHGANCYVTKPVDLDQFFAVVRAIEDFWLSVAALPPHGKPNREGI